MKVLFFWEKAGLSLDRANPHGGLLARALSQLGVELLPGYPEPLSESCLEENRSQIDVLHLHWPSFLFICQCFILTHKGLRSRQFDGWSVTYGVPAGRDASSNLRTTRTSGFFVDFQTAQSLTGLLVRK